MLAFIQENIQMGRETVSTTTSAQLETFRTNLEPLNTEFNKQYGSVYDVSLMQDQIQLSQQDCKQAIENMQIYRNTIGNVCSYLEHHMLAFYDNTKQQALITQFRAMKCQTMHLLLLFQALLHASEDSLNRVSLRLEAWKLGQTLMKNYDAAYKQLEDFSVWLLQTERNIQRREESESDSETA